MNSQQLQSPSNAWLDPVDQVEKESTTRKATPQEIRRAIKTGRPVYKRITRQVIRKIDIIEATK